MARERWKNRQYSIQRGEKTGEMCQKCKTDFDTHTAGRAKARTPHQDAEEKNGGDPRPNTAGINFRMKPGNEVEEMPIKKE